MNELILIDILDNVDPELVECFKIERDVKREKKRKNSVFARLNSKRIFADSSFSIDNFGVEKELEDEARRNSEIKAFGRVVTPSEASTGLRIEGVKKASTRKGAFRMTTAIAGICLGICGVLTVIVKLKSGTRNI